MYNSTFNARLIKVKYKGDYALNKKRSIVGEPLYTEVIISNVTSYLLDTWVDFNIARKQLLTQQNTDVVAEWECSSFTFDVIRGIINRDLGVGDQVQFNVDSRWFLIGNVIHDGGLFFSNLYYKFTLLRSDVP